ncbi:sulfurtransferase [Glycomyces buryatensis]|uniref:Sulfurtransferase n=1 Tax=Glycomyces buryatensis TaxID=2570927 RepID=A0A4S8QEA0_9ACTN|nr:sulfurtransferase [Glycomyces buryatensis]THV42660.1 sulfurtransferase [Glycomyces buryatensis]
MSPLIGADEVADLAGAVLLDVRWTLGGPSKEADYAAGHLPGAVWIDFDRDVCGRVGAVGGRHPLPDPEVLQVVLREAGIDSGTPVVVYDDGDGMAAARTWWTLRWAGHEDVRVLDGGLAAWTRSGRELTTDVPSPPPGAFTVTPGAMTVLDADEAATWADERELVDVRAPERYRGENEPIDPVAGHIPGAVNLPLAEDNASGGGLVDADTLRGRYEKHTEAAFYCGSGVGAARTALAVTAARLPTPPIYIGSWSDWTSQGRQAATGEES